MAAKKPRRLMPMIFVLSGVIAVVLLIVVVAVAPARHSQANKTIGAAQVPAETAELPKPTGDTCPAATFDDQYSHQHIPGFLSAHEACVLQKQAVLMEKAEAEERKVEAEQVAEDHAKAVAGDNKEGGDANITGESQPVP